MSLRSANEGKKEKQYTRFQSQNFSKSINQTFIKRNILDNRILCYAIIQSKLYVAYLGYKTKQNKTKQNKTKQASLISRFFSMIYLSN